MADDRISSVISEKAFDEVDRMQEKLISLEKLIQQFDLELGDTRSISQANTLLSEMAVNTERVTAAVKEQTQATQAKTKVDKEDLAYQKELEKQAKANEKTLIAIEKAKQRDAKIANEASSAYKTLSKAYQDAALRAKDYGLELGKAHPITVQAAADANAMADRLKELDAMVGQHQRNVGNYNMVGAQFNQLLRELPNAGISARTFLMSITNNASYFAEAIRDAKAQGQSWGNILKTLGSSLFGFTGLLNIAIAAVTYWALNSKNAADSTDKLAESTKRYNEALVSASTNSKKNAQQEIDRLTILNKIATDTTASMRARTKAAQEMQDLYPSILGNYSKEAILAGEVAGRIDDITKALLLRAQAEAASKKLEATETRIIELREQQRTAVAQLAALEAKVFKSKEDETGVTYALAVADRARAKERLSNIQSELKLAQGLRDNYLGYAKETAEASFNAIDLTTTKTTQSIDKITKEIEENIRYRADLELDYADALEGSIEIETKNRINALYEIRAAELDQLMWLEMSLREGGITYEAYEKRKAEIAKKYALERANTELAYAEVVKKYTTDPEKIKEVTQRIDELRLAIAKLNNETSAGGTTEKKEDIDFSGLIQRLQALSQISQEIFGIFSDQMQSKLRDLQKEGQLIEENGQREIRRIQNSSLTEEQKQEAIREQEARTESQRRANEARQREAARKKAQFDKQAAIAQIILSTSIAVLKAWETGITPADRAAGAAIAAAVGAAQLARAVAAPLPQYEDGTLNHRGGAFIAGEKESELVLTPKGKAYWTDNKPTMYNEPKGTQVFNSDMLNSLLGAGLTPRLLSLMDRKKDNSAREMASVIEEAIERTGKNTVRAIYQNRAIQNVNVNSPDYYYLSKVKGKS